MGSRVWVSRGMASGYQVATSFGSQGASHAQGTQFASLLILSLAQATRKRDSLLLPYDDFYHLQRREQGCDRCSPQRYRSQSLVLTGEWAAPSSDTSQILEGPVPQSLRQRLSACPLHVFPTAKGLPKYCRKGTVRQEPL